MSGEPPTSRAREQVGGDEEATSNLKLGEFQNVHSMSLSEARALIIAILAHRATTKKVEETECVFSIGRQCESGWGIEKDQAKAKVKADRFA